MLLSNLAMKLRTAVFQQFIILIPLYILINSFYSAYDNNYILNGPLSIHFSSSITEPSPHYSATLSLL